MDDEITPTPIPITPVTRLVVLSLLRQWINEHERKLALIAPSPELQPWIDERYRILGIVRQDLAAIEIT